MTQNYQPSTVGNGQYPFLRGGGEMGNLTRTHDWAKTSLGPPETWPQSLRTTLGIVLNSAFPMFLFWGDEHTYFYNDAFRPSLGINGKHPAIGKPGNEVWPEIWNFIGHIIEQVMTNSEPVCYEDQLLPIYRNGRLEDVYWTFSHSPAYGDDGEVAGVFVACTETTAAVMNRHKLAESETHFRRLTDTAPAILWITEPDGHCSYLNKQWYDQTGQTESEAEDFGWLDATHPDDKKEAGRLFLEANEKQIPFSALYRLRHKDGSYRWVIDKGSPRFGPNGEYEGIIGTVMDIHEQYSAELAQRESETRFQTMADDSGILIAVSDETSNATYFNKAWTDLTGHSVEDLIAFGWVDLVHPDDRERFVNIYLSAFEKRESFTGEFRLLNKNGEYRCLLANGTARFRPGLDGPDGSFAGYISSCVDITERKQAEESLRASENLFRNVTNSAPTGLWLSDETGSLTYLNKTLVEWTGMPYDALLGAGWASAIIDEDRERSANTFLTAVATRSHYDVAFRLKKPDGSILWCQASGDPYYDEKGRYAGYAGFCMDIDELVQQRQAIEMSEAKLRSIIDTAPVAIGLFMGRDLVIELPNQTFIDIVGKGPDIAGKPLREVMPELLNENQPFLNILDEVFTSGRQFHTDGSMVQIMRQGVLTDNYYNITYTPLFNEAGEVYAILDIAVDVTEAVLDRQKVEEAEASLRGAVELAQLGTWSIDVATNGITYSDRVADWLGYDSGSRPYTEMIPILETNDRQRVETAVVWALNPASDGVYDEIYTVIHPKTGKKRILHAQGKTVVDATGKAVRMNGTVQDITIQRELQLVLENKVEKRTRQLRESVQDLERSNQNLQQFAYIASHDLQEPLRKIQSFSDLLKTQYADQLGEGVEHLQRMQTAASRMSTLIRDLLSFSRIATQQDDAGPVSLTNVVDRVLSNLDLVISETGAQVLMEPLPTVPGDASQLGQLFQNLLGNALKFWRPNQTDGPGDPVGPVIRVSTRPVAVADLPASVKPTRTAAAYHCIEVSDNGIGFDEKYLDRIFQVFQRLHGRNEFAGTGIGLAICEKVVANHGGAITATSQPGQGATFSVYLPV